MSYANSTPENPIDAWQPDDDRLLLELQKAYGNKWMQISHMMAAQGKHRTINSIRNRYLRLVKGRTTVGQNLCQICRQPRNGHICKKKDTLYATKNAYVFVANMDMLAQMACDRPRESTDGVFVVAEPVVDESSYWDNIKGKVAHQNDALTQVAKDQMDLIDMIGQMKKELGFVDMVNEIIG